MKQYIILALLSHVNCVNKFNSAMQSQYEAYDSYPQGIEQKLHSSMEQQPQKLSSSFSRRSINIPMKYNKKKTKLQNGDKKTSSDEDGDTTPKKVIPQDKAVKIYQDKLYKGKISDKKIVDETCGSWDKVKKLECLGTGSMCHPGNKEWLKPAINHFFYNPFTQTNEHRQNCFVVQNEYAYLYKRQNFQSNKNYQSTLTFGAHNFNMYGYSSKPIPQNNTYTQIQKSYIPGANLYVRHDKSLAECKEICDNDSLCKAFEFYVFYEGHTAESGWKLGDCKPQSTADNPGVCEVNGGGCYNSDLYIKVPSSGKGDPEKDKNFYPVKSLTVHTTVKVGNHGRWICGMELTFWDTEVQERYSDPGRDEQHEDYGCGDDYGGITNSYDFQRGEQLMEMSAFSNGYGTEPKHFSQTYYEWNAISKLQFKTSKGDTMWDSTKGEKYAYSTDVKGFEFKFDVEQRFLMGMTGGFRKGIIEYHDLSHSAYKSTPLYSLGPLLSEKVIAREIGNYRDRKMDQTPSGGASIVNRTLCNDDYKLPRTVNVVYNEASSQEVSCQVTQRKYEESSWEGSLSTSIMIGKNVDGGGDSNLDAGGGGGEHWSFGVEYFFQLNGLESKENTKDLAQTKLVEKTNKVNYTLEANPRTEVTVQIQRADKQISKPWVVDIDLKFANGAKLFRGELEGISKGNDIKSSEVYFTHRQLKNGETCSQKELIKKAKEGFDQNKNSK